jgi:predicted AlkP superfamily phosphohydrolase/phosphomutase
MQNKLLIVGIDSATFDIIEPLVNQNSLPNLKHLMEKGCWGRLTSTIPPVTPPAWTSIVTGKNPGKHGVFDFYASPCSGYRRSVITARANRAKTLWKILSERGLKVGALNVPLTYPPEEINGFIVPGMQYALSPEKDFTYPPGLLAELQEALGSYEVVWGDLESLYTDKLDEFWHRWEKILEIRKKATLYLMQKYHWDFFMVVFYAIDPIQHHFWSFFDPTHPLHNPRLAQKYKDIIPYFYQKIDDAIGEILQHVDENTNVIIVSDHGAGPEHKSFYLNLWLYKEGLLKFKEIPYNFLARIKWPHFIYKTLRRLKFPGIAWTVPLDQLRLLGKYIDPREGLEVSYFIDWSKTKAFAGNHTEQGIYLNVKGREPQGIVEPGAEYEELREYIIRRLYQLEDPDIRGKVVNKVYKREEVYSGPYIKFAPDLFLVLKNGSYLAQKECYPGPLFRYTNKTTGTHSFEGIFIAKGKNIKKGQGLTKLHVTDVTPTVLHLLDQPIPSDMDGRVLTEITQKHAHPQYCKESSQIQQREEGFSETEDEEIRNTLRNLGYL